MEILRKREYVVFFSILAVIYGAGLFIPLMDNDSAHHANIALRMVQENDYINLVDRFRDYLDKPHLLFWLSAASFKLFGIYGWAYKLPSVLFSILAVYSTYRLGRLLYDPPTGRLAALVLATAQAFILSNHDVRMDALLTACTISGIWQLTEYLLKGKSVNILLGALGIAMGVATKGMVAAGTAGIALFCFVLFRRNWKYVLHWKVLMGLAAFFIFLSPVLYAYYLQFDLHPEKVIAGRQGVSGVKFILWEQNFERMGGGRFDANSRNDYFFFLHTFLWAFLPWSLLTYAAVFQRYKGFFKNRRTLRHTEMLTLGGITILMILFSLSDFKLPHYLNILFPLFSILLAAHLQRVTGPERARIYLYLQYVVAAACTALAWLLCTWVFPLTSVWKILVGILLTGLTAWYLLGKNPPLRKAVLASVSVILLVNFLLNVHFYPQLLRYQSGKYLAETIQEKDIPLDRVYIWPTTDYNYALDFYTQRINPEIRPEELDNLRSPVWISMDEAGLAELSGLDVQTGQVFTQPDYRITRLTGQFLNPATRPQTLSKHYLVEVLP